MAADIPQFTLNTGAKMPSVGMGCWQGEAGSDGLNHELIDALLLAFKTGYRHLDTATMYRNEVEVGEAVRRSGLPRSEFFVTTKMPPPAAHDPVAAFEKSLKDLNIEYIDLWLMHWPHGLNKDGEPYGYEEEKHLGPTFNERWAQMEDIFLNTHKGKVKAIGISNFSPKTLPILLKTAKVVPAVNQIEAHPYLPDLKLLDLCKEKGIHVTAYSPLGQRNTSILSDEDLIDIAAKYKVTVGQVALSWAVQRGTSVAPKSTNEGRMKQNITLIKLSDDDMKRITDIHKDAARSTRLCLDALQKGNPRIMGWTLEQLGWDVGFNVGDFKILPKSQQ